MVFTAVACFSTKLSCPFTLVSRRLTLEYQARRFYFIFATFTQNYRRLLNSPDLQILTEVI